MGSTDLPYSVSFEVSTSGVACVYRGARHAQRVHTSRVRQQDLVTSTCTSARTSRQAEARVYLYLNRKLRCGHHRGDHSTYGPSGIRRSTCCRSACRSCEAYSCHRRTGIIDLASSCRRQRSRSRSGVRDSDYDESRATNLPQLLFRAPLSHDVQEVRLESACPRLTLRESEEDRVIAITYTSIGSRCVLCVLSLARR